MLFDTSSPGRKRVIRIVYGILAVLFLVGFLGFGIGTSGSLGGLFDALGITDSNGGGGGDSALEQQISDLDARVKKHPDDPNALTTLVNLHFRQAVAKYSENQNLDDARPDLDAALNAWEKYLKTDPKQPSTAAAPFAAQAYQAIGDYKRAAEAQQIVVDANPKSIPQYVTLASYYYADGNFDKGRAVAKEAESKVSGKQRQKAQKTFDKLEQLARKQAKAQKQAEKAGGGQAGQGLDNPFGSLGGASGLSGGATP